MNEGDIALVKTLGGELGAWELEDQLPSLPLSVIPSSIGVFANGVGGGNGGSGFVRDTGSRRCSSSSVKGELEKISVAGTPIIPHRLSSGRRWVWILKVLWEASMFHATSSFFNLHLPLLLPSPSSSQHPRLKSTSSSSPIAPKHRPNFLSACI